MFAERYFTDRDLINKTLPAAGDEQICIDFVGGPYLFSGLSRARFEVLKSRYEDLYLDPDSSPSAAVCIDVYQADRRDFRSDWIVGEEYTLDLLREPGQIDVAGMFFGARLHQAPDLGGKFLTCPDEEDFFLGGFENLFRVLVAYRLQELGGVLLHSAGIVKNEKASIFYGVSGAGKSTLSKKALGEGCTVLSDDLNAVIIENDRVFVSPVPFAGDLGRGRFESMRYEVSGIYRLQQGDGCRYNSFKSSRFLAAALACSPFVNANRLDSTRLEDNLLQISSAIATGEVISQAQTSFNQIMDCVGAVQPRR